MGATPVNLFGQPGAQQQPGASIVDTILSRFLAGAQIAQTIRQANQEAETRKLNQDILKHQLSALQLQEKLSPIQQQFEVAKLLQGQQAPQVSASSPMPDLANALTGGGQTASAATFGTRPPVNIDLSSVLPGAGNFQVPIESQQDMFARTLRERFATGRVEAASAGAKAGSEAAAKSPYEIQLEEAKAKAEADRLAFTQGEENKRAKLSSDTSMGVARMNLSASNAQRATERENKLTDDFRTDTKEFNVIDDAYARVKAAAALGSGPGDIALIYGFMKLQDPNSSVREGEYATAQNASGIPDRIRAQYNKLVDGEKLAPAVRQNFIATAKTTYEAVQPRLKKIENQYQTRARKQGVDPGLFKFQGGGTGEAAPSGPIAINPQTGAKVQWNGSAWVPVQ